MRPIAISVIGRGPWRRCATSCGRRSFAAAVVAAVVADLQRQKLLDDREFARRWVEARLPRAHGARKLAQDLRHKGVAAGVVDEVLAEYAPGARFGRTRGRVAE